MSLLGSVFGQSHSLGRRGWLPIPGLSPRLQAGPGSPAPLGADRCPRLTLTACGLCECVEMRQTNIKLRKELGDAIRDCVQKHGPEAWYQNVLLALASELQLNGVELFEGDNQQQVTRVGGASPRD